MLYKLRGTVKIKKTPLVAQGSLWILSSNVFFAYASCTLTAFKPFLPSFVSKVTTSPSRTLSTKPLTCTNTSSPVDQLTTKPKPLVSLKNLIVPFCILKKLKKWKVIAPKDAAKVSKWVENQSQLCPILAHARDRLYFTCLKRLSAENQNPEAAVYLGIERNPCSPTLFTTK